MDMVKASTDTSMYTTKKTCRKRAMVSASRQSASLYQ